MRLPAARVVALFSVVAWGQVGAQPANNIASMNLNTQVWSTMGGGTSNTVQAIGCGDADGVHLLVGEQVLVMFVGFGLVPFGGGAQA